MPPAVPDSSSPAANAPMPEASEPSGPSRSDHCPASTIPNRLVVKYPENAKAYRATPPSSRAATGIAVPTAVASKAITSTTDTMPMLSARYGRLSTPPVSSDGTVVAAARASSAVMAASVRCAARRDSCPKAVINRSFGPRTTPPNQPPRGS